MATADKRKRPVLWGETDLEQKLLAQALILAERQGMKRKAPKRRPPVETDPELDGWFD